MIQYPNLLVSKVLKAKYFPKDSILKCKVSKASSWFWQSIMTARELVKQGTIRLVGNGRITRIWEDNWIPGNPQGKPTTKEPPNNELQKVDELILNHRWRRSLIYRVFNKEDAEKILNIPVSISGREDRHFWKHSNNGQYTVRSSYKLMNKQREGNDKRKRSEEASSSDESNNQIWKTLWKLKIKHKIKTFVWRCLTNTLPANEAIFQRIKQGDPVCKGCGNGIETIEHMRFQCEKAKQI